MQPADLLLSSTIITSIQNKKQRTCVHELVWWEDEKNGNVLVGFTVPVLTGGNPALLVGPRASDQAAAGGLELLGLCWSWADAQGQPRDGLCHGSAIFKVKCVGNEESSLYTCFSCTHKLEQKGRALLLNGCKC